MQDHSFKILLFQNKKQKKLLHTAKKRETAINKFNELKNKSDTIICSKKTLYDKQEKKYKEADYELLLIDHNENQKEMRDAMGRLVSDKDIIIKRIPFYYEEKFLVTTDNKKLNAREIYNKYIGDNNHKTISIIQNKVVIETDFLVHLAICKTVEDAVRLHNALQNYAIKNKLLNSVFFGKTQREERKKMWQRLSKKTDLPLPYLYKNTTR